MAESTLYRIVYVSSATHLFSKQELLDLLEKAREKTTSWVSPACCYTRMGTSSS
jgi:hypothetical protein